VLDLEFPSERGLHNIMSVIIYFIVCYIANGSSKIVMKADALLTSDSLLRV